MSGNSYPSRKKAKTSVMRRVRASKVLSMEIDSTSLSNITDQNSNTSMHDDDGVLYMINDDYVGDYSDPDLTIDALIESEKGESEEDDAYAPGGDD